MYQGKKVTAILLAGGSGSRFGGEKNKVYQLLGGKPVLSHSLEALAAHEAVDQLIPVIKKGQEEEIAPLLEELKRVCPDSAEKLHAPVYGGDTRQASVYEGLKEAEGEYVLVHDGARPMLQAAFIERCLEAVTRYPGAAAGVPSKDTIKIVDENGLVCETTDRSRTWIVQTPQCFRRKELLAAHQKWQGSQVMTDDCMVMEAEGYAVQLVMGDYNNLKVTIPEDLEILKEIWNRK